MFVKCPLFCSFGICREIRKSNTSIWIYAHTNLKCKNIFSAIRMWYTQNVPKYPTKTYYRRKTGTVRRVPMASAYSNCRVPVRRCAGIPELCSHSRPLHPTSPAAGHNCLPGRAGHSKYGSYFRTHPVGETSRPAENYSSQVPVPRDPAGSIWPGLAEACSPGWLHVGISSIALIRKCIRNVIKLGEVLSQ